MLVVMRQGADEAEVRGVVTAVEARGYKAHPIPGAQRTAIGITGNKGAAGGPGLREPARRARGHPGHPRLQAGLPRGQGGEQHRRTSAGWRWAGRSSWWWRAPAPWRSREQMLTVARAVKAAGAHLLRGGAFKPRTSPYAFQGLGEEGLKHPRRGAGGDRPAGGDRGGGRARPGPRRGVRRRHPDRRAQHAELLPAEARGQGAQAGDPQAGHVRHPRGVPDVGRVHPGRGELRR